MKIGDKKEKIKFAIFPVKITNKLKGSKYCWLKKYKDTYEYQQLKRREIQPVEGIVSEDAKPLYDRRFSQYEWVIYEEWVRIKREVLN